jgi:3-oxoacyl-[acyl-carrier-protein] synthase-3
MDATARKLAIAPEKIISTVGEHANTSAASIPLALASACGGASGQKRIAPGDLVLMTTVGGGFTWGAMLARW